MLRVNLNTTYDMFPFLRPKLILYLLFVVSHLLGRVNLKKKLKIDSRAENGSFEDRGESGTEAKALLCATRIPLERHRHIMLKSINGYY